MTHQPNEFRFTVHPEASASFHDNGVVILHLGSGRLFSSNQAGASIWRRVEQRLPLEAISREISSEYQIASSTSRDHVAHFLSTLEQHTLIQREAVS
ncbi:MAG TPA: PqqD family protein [Candidatus Angelobacter sp.]|nr:PqqD family protein [Candidatus Angelobacter sp.]